VSSLKKNLSPSVVKRLPRYFSYVKGLHDSGVEWVSSATLAEELGLTSSTVRQDFTCFSFMGIAKRGYQVSGLLDMLAEIIGADMEWRVIVVGAGNLGRALVQHGEFVRRGFNIVGIFDADEAKYGVKIGRLEVQSMDRLDDFVKREDIRMGIIAVPDSAGQSVADLLVKAGVKGLLNMTMAHIVVPDNVAVSDSRIVASLQQLSHCVLFSCPHRRSK